MRNILYLFDYSKFTNHLSKNMTASEARSGIRSVQARAATSTPAPGFLPVGSRSASHSKRTVPTGADTVGATVQGHGAAMNDGAPASG